MDVRFFMTIAQVEQQFDGRRVADDGPAFFARDVDATAEAIRVAYYNATLASHPGYTHELAESTQVTTTVEGTRATFDTAQPAESHENMDGSGGHQQYVQWLLPPGRGAIEAPSTGPYSTGKKALYSPFFGPYKRVKAYPGDPYPLKADPEVTSALDLFASRWSADVMRGFFA